MESSEFDNMSFEERQRAIKAPIKYKIYKGIKGSLGALRLSLKPAYTDMNKDAGCVFLEMAPADGLNHYNWEDKTIMKLDLTDISKILHVLRSPNAFGKDGLEIYHDKGAGTVNKGKESTVLKINKPDGKDNFFWNLYGNSTTGNRSATITVSVQEAIVISLLLQAAVPKILSW